MTRTRITPILSLLTLSCVFVASQAHADIGIENTRTSLVIAANARWQSLIDKLTRRELAPDSASLPIAEVRHGNQRCEAIEATADGDRLTVSFAHTDTVLTCALERAEDWIVLRLRTVAGTRPDSLTLLLKS